MSGFYPHGKPAWYAYTQYFVDVYGGKTGYLAGANTKYPGLNSDAGRAVVVKALWNLRTLIDNARAAELAFINDTGMNINDPNNAGDIFRTINLIFNSKQTFERGMQYMKNLQGAKKDEKYKMYRDVSRYFITYFSQIVHEEMDQKVKADIVKMNKAEVQALVNTIITNSLVRTYEKVYDFIDSNGKIRGKFGQDQAENNEQEVQAITDMIDVIKQIGSSGAFSQFGYLFDLDVDTLMKNKNQGLVKLKTKKYSDAEVDSNYGGSALELITSMVAAEIGKINIQKSSGDFELNIVGKHTGRDNQMKADTLLFVGRGNINVDDYLEYVDTDTFGNRVRSQNIDALGRYLDKLNDNIDHVIAISDKNYSITANFDGVNAQEKMNLQNVGIMLGQFGVDHVPELVTYLANCGNGPMVQGQVDDAVRTELQSYIGYFLFDNLHVEIQGSAPKVNVVNLMNVSGLYIPLSVYLEGLYNSIQDAAANPSSFVSVSISLGGPTEQPVWTATTWGEFREERETQSFISYRILKGIADFISNL